MDQNDSVKDTDFIESALELETEPEIESEQPAPKKGLRKLQKTKEEREAELAALSEVEVEGYVPEEHPESYDVKVDPSIYRNNYIMGGALVIIGIILFPYTKVATVLLWFYGLGITWITYRDIKKSIHVDGSTFTISGTKNDGIYTFDQVDKIIYNYNRKSQRRYWIHVNGTRLYEIPPGSVHSRWLFDDMMAYGVDGGLYQTL